MATDECLGRAEHTVEGYEATRAGAVNTPESPEPPAGRGTVAHSEGLVLNLLTHVQRALKLDTTQSSGGMPLGHRSCS